MGRRLVGILTAIVVVACGGGAATDTSDTDSASTTTVASSPSSSSPTTTTTPATTVATDSTTTTRGGSTLGLDDVPQECVEPLLRWVRDIEPFVTGYDFANANLEAFVNLNVVLIPAFTALAEAFGDSPQCADSGGSPFGDLWPALIDYARTEAPGSVAYLEVQEAVADLPGTGSCQADIAALQAFVDDGGVVSDLAAAERFHVFNLASSIGNWCDLRTGGEFLYRAEVVAFLETG